MNSAMYSSTTGRYPAIAAPIAIPISAVSEIGVTRTRSGPNAFRYGSSSWVAMFWPKWRTVWSRSISWWIASPIAAMYGSSRAISRLLSGVDVFDGFLGRREGAGEREVDRLLHLGPHALGDLVGLLGAQRPVLDEPPA